MLPDTYFLIMFPFSNLPNNDYTVCIKRQTQSLSIYKKLPCLLLTHCNYFRSKLFLVSSGERTGSNRSGEEFHHSLFFAALCLYVITSPHSPFPVFTRTGF